MRVGAGMPARLLLRHIPQPLLPKQFGAPHWGSAMAHIPSLTFVNHRRQLGAHTHRKPSEADSRQSNQDMWRTFDGISKSKTITSNILFLPDCHFRFVRSRFLIWEAWGVAPGARTGLPRQAAAWPVTKRGGVRRRRQAAQLFRGLSVSSRFKRQLIDACHVYT